MNRWIPILVLAALLISCGNPSPSQPAPGDNAQPMVVIPKYKPGELLVKLKPGVNPSALAVSAKRLGAITTRSFQIKSLSARPATAFRWQHVVLASGSDVKSAHGRPSSALELPLRAVQRTSRARVARTDPGSMPGPLDFTSAFRGN